MYLVIIAKNSLPDKEGGLAERGDYGGFTFPCADLLSMPLFLSLYSFMGELVEILQPIELQNKIVALKQAYAEAIGALERDGFLRDLFRAALASVLKKPLPSCAEDCEKALKALDEAVEAFEEEASKSVWSLSNRRRADFGQELNELLYRIYHLQRDLYNSQTPYQSTADLEPLRALLCRLHG